MNNNIAGKSVLICDTQPVAMEGLRWLLDSSGDLRCVATVATLDAASELAVSLQPSAISVDQGFGNHAVMGWLEHMSATVFPFGSAPAPVLWGSGVNESAALRFLQAGARGIIRRTSPPETMLSCLRAVTNGSTWMEEEIFGNAQKLLVKPRDSHLTPREREVTELVERGLRNRDIGRRLGIQTGTVKIHMKHIFEKTGVRGRYDLALTGLRQKGTLAIYPLRDAPVMQEETNGCQ